MRVPDQPKGTPLTSCNKRENRVLVRACRKPEIWEFEETGNHNLRSCLENFTLIQKFTIHVQLCVLLILLVLENMIESQRQRDQAERS